MDHRAARGVLACLMTSALLALGAVDAGAVTGARDVDVTSFDGSTIKAHLFPAHGLLAGQRAPTVLVGSGWATPMYPDWLPSVGAIALGGVAFDAELLGPAELSTLGYNVVTWANRGWYGSGGEVMIDHPDYEGRDVSALLDWLAAQPEAQLDGPGDPRVGMNGVSYGGGIQLSAALRDHRIDVIEPNMSWNSLIDSLYPNETVKSGWGNILCGLSGVTLARRAPVVVDLCESAISGVVTADEIAYDDPASPGDRVAQITAPTLLLGGTVDTLFPLSGNVATYELLRRAGTPVKMMWYCGGHGLCDQSTGPANHVLDVERAFLARYLKGEQIDTGPGFEYLDQNGTWHSARSYPPRTVDELVATGSGSLGLSPEHQSGVLGIMATSAANAVVIPIPPPDTARDLVAAPSLELTYRGRADKARASVFVQLVDTSTGKVLGNQATPVPLTLDGGSRTATVELARVAWHLTPSSRVALQITDNTNLFIAQGATGKVQLDAELTLPLARSGR